SPTPRTPKQARPRLEALEDRAVPAMTFTVSNLNDSGTGSLRQAILDANGAAGADVIQFQAGLTGTITLTSGELSVTHDLNIQGPGANVRSASGNNASRASHLNPGAATDIVTISGLTITGGNATGTTGNGGGVDLPTGTLNLTDCVITGNTAAGDNGGGGIKAPDAPPLNLLPCQGTNNNATAHHRPPIVVPT